METTFLERLRDEETQLSEKITKLQNFVYSDKFREIEEIQKSLLKIQLNAMKTYQVCLNERLYHIN